MDKDAFLFSSLDMAIEKNIYGDNYFSLEITRHGNTPYQVGWIINLYLVPSLNANLLSVSQLTQSGKFVKFWSRWFFIKDQKNDRSIIIYGFLDSRDLSWPFS